MKFYHSTTPEQWDLFKDKDYYEAESLHTEGFIHASYQDQLEETLNLYFKNIPKVLILTIDPSVLSSELLLEPSRNGELFPHIYGSINKSAIVNIEERQIV